MPQPDRNLTPELRDAILAGGYWLREPVSGVEVALVCSGVVVAEALEARELMSEDIAGIGILVLTSPDRLFREWNRSLRRAPEDSPPHIKSLLGSLTSSTTLVTLMDGHPATLSWLGGVMGRCVIPLGPDQFGQSGSLKDIYRLHHIDGDAVLEAVAELSVRGYPDV